VPATEPEQPETNPVFCADDAEGIKFKNGSGLKYDKADLIQKPLQWDLTAAKPTVLILHTHATESYTRQSGELYEESSAYRTLNSAYNMLSVGEELARVLEAGGISVIHDTTLYDYPDYNNAYSGARKAIKRHLEQHPGIQLVLDLHRDASDGTEGQLVTSATAGGQRCAQIMVVAGTDAGGNRHPDWQENLSLGLKLSALLEQTNPGITRPISLRAQRFNMDLTPGSLLIEVGAAGNTRQEALQAAQALAEGILALAGGAN
jgi:stage II sporulation protein P